jgi:moderate conductance mechanosensitive channel
MRSAVFMLVLLLGFIPAAQAQTGASLLGGTHKPGAAKPAAAAPAAPPAPAIIPGSPLATLASATTPANKSPEAPAALPFGSGQLAFAVSGAVGDEAVNAFNGFLGAVRASTRLEPVTEWLKSYRADPFRHAEAVAILKALLTIVLPAALVDVFIRLGLRRPAALCARWALPRQEEFLPSYDPPDDSADGSPNDASDDVRGLAAAEAGATEAPPGRYVSLRAWGRRLLFALLKFALAALPLAGFIAAAQLLLSAGFVTVRAGQLAASGLANAYLISRAVQEVARLLLSPAAPSLRLITMPTSRATALMQWVMVVLATILFSCGLIASALLLSLPKDGATALIRIAALVVHIELAIGIWQCRKVVAGWIIGDPKATGAVAWLRQRFGQWWHYFALFYVLSLWVAWAGGVKNAFAVLLRAVVVLVAAVVIGRFAWSGSAALLERLFPDPASTAAKGRHPTFLARARAYNPILRFLIRAGIGIAAVLFVLQGWGLDVWGWLQASAVSRALLRAITSVFTTTAVALLLWELVNYILHSHVERLSAAGRKRQASRLRTLAPILRGAAGTFIFVVALLVGLSEIGVNTTGLLAVSSIAGIAVGFGSQKLVQDIITGLFMLLEDAIQVGDVVTLATLSGTVEKLSIRTIHLRSSDGSINIIPFSSVTTITNQTRDFNNAEIAVTVGYDEDIDHICALLTDIGRSMRAEPGWGAMMRDNLQVFGVDKFVNQGMVITAQIRTGPGQNGAVRREFYRRVLQRFAEEGIAIPLGKQTMFKLEMPDPPHAAASSDPAPARSAAPAQVTKPPA